MTLRLSNILGHPTLYHYLRHWLAGGLPFKDWVNLYGLADPSERVADVGSGPADILRYLTPKRCPEFYLGIDVSERYLQAARQRAQRLGLAAEFRAMDLTLLSSNPEVQQQLVDLLENYRITRVLLLGVIHHIDDQSALTTMSVIHRATSVKALVTQDIIYLPGHRINNSLCSRDRGQYVRDEAGYDALVAQSPWKDNYRKFWTAPHVTPLKYIHYELRK